MQNNREVAGTVRKKKKPKTYDEGEGRKKRPSDLYPSSKSQRGYPAREKPKKRKSTNAVEGKTERTPERKPRPRSKEELQRRERATKKQRRASQPSRPSGPPPKPKWYNKLSDIFVTVLTLVMVALAVVFFLSRNESKSLFGYRVFTVLTNSMAQNTIDPHKDGFGTGDIIFVQNIDPKSAQVGDIITYHPSAESKAYLTHRVVKIQDELEGDPGPYYITKGDNNNSEDIPVHYSQVVAKVKFSIPKVGAVIRFISKHYVVSGIFIFSIYGFFWVMRNYLFQNVKKTPQKTRKKVVRA